jgi:hypothetical protein
VQRKEIGKEVLMHSIEMVILPLIGANFKSKLLVSTNNVLSY